MAQRAASDAAKLVCLWWALLAFIASGFEHSIANMTSFGLAAIAGTGTWGMLFRNLAYTVPGNIVGGGLLVGVAYGWLGTPVAPKAKGAYWPAEEEPVVVAEPEPAPPPVTNGNGRKPRAKATASS
jgi:nitrite transporter NirC